MKNFFKKTSCYTTLPNAFAQDDRLSIEARGLGLLIFSLPDDWVFQQTWFYEKAGGNRNRRKTVVKALNELIRFDYLCRIQDRKKGKFDGAIWFFDPEENAQAELKAILAVGTHGTNGTVGTLSASPDSASPKSTTTKEIETKEEIKKEISSSSSFPPISVIDPYVNLPDEVDGLSRKIIIEEVEAIAKERGGDFEKYREALVKEVLSGNGRTITNIRIRRSRINKREHGEMVQAALQANGYANIFDYLEDAHGRANENVQ
ncbi:MAG: hypothetical protein AB1763_10730 [Campylobacterota bacterium]